MPNQIVWTDGRTECIENDPDVEVIERFNFDDDLGALVVKGTEKDLSQHPHVKQVEAEFDATTQDIEALDADREATIEDVREIGNCPAGGNTGNGLTGVVMDSGIDESHPFFKGLEIKKHVDLTGTGDEDLVGHGTACAGQSARLAPDMDLISLKIFGNEGRTSGRIILKAYDWLMKNSDEYELVNMSWGASARSEQLDQLHNKLVRQNDIIPVVAAGNSGGPGGSPATAEMAFSVGACDDDGRMTNFSSYNPNRDNPDVTAVGKNNILARAKDTSMGQPVGDRKTKASGTSFACPEVFGMTGKMIETKSLTYEQALKAWEEGARDIGDTKRDGKGLADYRNAKNSRTTPPEPPKASVSVWSLWSGGQDIMYLDHDWFADGDWQAMLRTDENGHKVVEYRKK